MKTLGNEKNTKIIIIENELKKNFDKLKTFEGGVILHEGTVMDSSWFKRHLTSQS